MVVKYLGRVPFSLLLFIFCLFILVPATRTAQAREPIPTRSSSKDAVGREDVLYKQVFFGRLTFRGSFSPVSPATSLT